MSIADYKKLTSDIVHKVFSVTGFYSDENVSDEEIMVRFHRKSAYIGDDYDEFNPGEFASINRIIIDTNEVTPHENAKVYIERFGITVSIERFILQGEDKALCEVRLWASE